jgi:hypothetical protein
MCALTGQAGYALRRLERSEQQRDIRSYFSLIIRTLSWEWQEGETLRVLAGAVWVDPLVQTTEAAERLLRLSGRASYDASVARRLASQSASWRRQYAQNFTYVPVM